MIDLPIIDAERPGEEKSGRRFWRSFPQLENDPSAQKLARDEFMPGASAPGEDVSGGASRRQFLQLMGATMAMAGLTACRRPVEKILPYARMPEEIIPGVPLHYATAIPRRGTLLGLLVESHEGRPTKVEGNPDHPASLGATDPYAQASVLNLYDPDRSKLVLNGAEPSTWEAFAAVWAQLDAGSRVVVLAEPTSSPTVLALRDRLAQRFAGLEWITFRPEGDDAPRQGMQLAAGRPLRPHYDFENAEVVVSFDNDFLGPTDVNMVQNTRRFARSRRVEGPEDTMSRLYVVESAYSLTGGQADNRLRLRASEIPAFAAAVAARLGLTGAQGLAAPFVDHPWVEELAQDLQQAGPGAVVLAGDTQPAEIHALCAAINAALGSQVVSYLDTGEEAEAPLAQQLAGLVREMAAGDVDALVTLGVNPVYSLPADFDFAGAMAQVPLTVHAGRWVDETAQVSDWHLPLSHYLEAWGDGRSYAGTLSVIQPLIAPLFDTKSEVEIMNLLATGSDASGYDLVREVWAGFVPGDFEAGWRRLLHDGFLPGSEYPVVPSPGATVPDLGSVPLAAGADEMEVVFRLDPTVFDGEYSNNAYMQELPDPTTKIVWDNVALMSRATAEALGVEIDYQEGAFEVDLVEVRGPGGAVTLPAWVLPGHPDGSITVNFGYGRTLRSSRPERESGFFDLDAYTDIYARGPLANGVGANVYPLRSVAMERVAVGAEVVNTGQKYPISTTQEHGTMEERPIVRYVTLDEFRENPDFAEDAVEPLPGMEEYGESWAEYPPLWEDQSPYDQPAYKDSILHQNQWGMTVDLNLCTGCKACVVACNSENNIQMVGKEEVARGREMHWLRIDRYFVSEGEQDADEALMVTQPMLCQHCETAPCESVCPVAATSHSADGLNEMTYNRCIGTRYCSNNCPYKVRRFNFFNWAKTIPETVEMAQNPDVTVRFRGVMEKCTFCVQRIRSVQRQANIEDRQIRDLEVMTACQQVCPAEAITFGDLTDPTSAVVRSKRDPRGYNLLEHLATKPRLSYLGRLYNPNPRLAVHAAEPEA